MPIEHPIKFALDVHLDHGIFIPESRHIAKIDPEVGGDSYLATTLKDIVPHLPISEDIKGGLIQLAESYEEASLHVLSSTEGEDLHNREGRGGYSYHLFNNTTPITIYTKGGGMRQALIENPEDLFGMFGPIKEKYLFDKPNHDLHFPRINGIEYLMNAKEEFYHALRVMINLIRINDIKTFKELMDAKITIPLSVSHHPGLTAYLKGKVEPELGENWKWNDNVQAGAVSLIVPGDSRTSLFPFYDESDFGPTLSPKKKRELAFIQGAKPSLMPAAVSIKNLYLSSEAFFHPRSAHYQNIYNIDDSICPSADSSDLVFAAGLEKDISIKTFSYEIFQFLSSILIWMRIRTSHKGITAAEVTQMLEDAFMHLVEDQKLANVYANTWFAYPEEISRRIALNLEAQKAKMPSENQAQGDDLILNSVFNANTKQYQEHQVKRISDLKEELSTWKPFEDPIEEEDLEYAYRFFDQVTRSLKDPESYEKICTILTLYTPVKYRKIIMELLLKNIELINEEDLIKSIGLIARSINASPSKQSTLLERFIKEIRVHNSLTEISSVAEFSSFMSDMLIDEPENEIYISISELAIEAATIALQTNQTTKYKELCKTLYNDRLDSNCIEPLSAFIVEFSPERTA